MSARMCVSIVLISLLVMTPAMMSAQIDPGHMPVKIYGILDVRGDLLGTIVVVGESARGFEAGFEYWTFDEEALVDIGHQKALELAVLGGGEWDDPWIVDVLGWRPAGPAVRWQHAAEIEWTPQREMRPPVVPDGVYFGNATVGGLMIQYVPEGRASLTWFKPTEGPFMDLEVGAVFKRRDAAPAVGAWWQGEIEVQN